MPAAVLQPRKSLSQLERGRMTPTIGITAVDPERAPLAPRAAARALAAAGCAAPSSRASKLICAMNFDKALGASAMMSGNAESRSMRAPFITLRSRPGILATLRATCDRHRPRPAMGEGPHRLGEVRTTLPPARDRPTSTRARHIRHRGLLPCRPRSEPIALARLRSPAGVLLEPRRLSFSAPRCDMDLRK